MTADGVDGRARRGSLRPMLVENRGGPGRQVTMNRLALLYLAASLATGCYLSHRAETGEPLDGGPVPEAPPVPRDAGRPTGPIDAGPPLPPEPDPDPGPDPRPSDYPEADDWEEPPAIGPDDPCCVLSEPVQLTSRAAGIPLWERLRVAWGPGYWGVLAGQTEPTTRSDTPAGLLFWELEENGTPLTSPRPLENPPNDDAFTIITPVALRWAEGRWGIAAEASRDEGRHTYARLFDRELRPATGWLGYRDGVARPADLVRLSQGDRWIGASSDGDTLWLRTIRAGRPEPAVSSGVATFHALHGAGLRSRLALMVQGRTETRAQVAVTDGEELLGLVPLDLSGTESAFTDLRDVAVAFAWEGDRLMTQVVDPFDLSVESERAPIASRDATGPIADEPIAAVGSNKLGLAGACYGLPSGSRGGSGIGFALVGPDGAPRGQPVAVVESTFRGDIVSCAVGSDEGGFLVAWWNGTELWVRRVDVAR